MNCRKARSVRGEGIVSGIKGLRRVGEVVVGGGYSMYGDKKRAMKYSTLIGRCIFFISVGGEIRSNRIDLVNAKREIKLYYRNC